MRRVFALFLCFMLTFIICACNDEKVPDSGRSSVETDYYISVNNVSLSKGYIGYFFYVAQETMLSEAGWNETNMTAEDVKTYWETTEIDGVRAVDAARDVAAKNAVEQKVKYYKAVSEGITMTEDEISLLESEIETIAQNNGGLKVFDEVLASKGTDIESYREILTELEYIEKLYEKYMAEGVLSLSDDEFDVFYKENAGKYPDSEMSDRAFQSKFNEMAKNWEAGFPISINDSKMDDFVINYN